MPNSVISNLRLITPKRLTFHSPENLGGLNEDNQFYLNVILGRLAPKGIPSPIYPRLGLPPCLIDVLNVRSLDGYYAQQQEGRIMHGVHWEDLANTLIPDPLATGS